MKTNTLDFDAQALRERILDLAMRGKLVPQDPNDEPASVLLEKIKAEKEELVKEKKIKKSKPLPEITDDEKPFDIPDSWEWVRCQDVTTIGNFQTVSSNDITLGENLIELADIESYSGKLINFETVVNKVGSNKYRYTEGQVLFAKLRPYLRKVLVAPNNGVCTTELLPIDGLKLSNNYLYYVFMSNFFFNQIKKEMHGVNLPRVSPQKLAELIFPLPPLSEQSRIAAKIAQLFALLRKVESSTQQYAELQTLLKSKVLDLAMRGKLVKQDPNDEPASVLLEKIKAEKAELVKEKKIKKSKPLPPITDEEKPFDIPDSWEWVRLGDIATLISGKTEKALTSPFGVKAIYFKISDMNYEKNSLFAQTSQKSIVIDNENQFVPAGAVIFPKRGGAINTNKKRIVKCKNMVIDMNLMAISPVNCDMGGWIYWWFSSIDLKSIANGSNVPQINNKDIEPLLVPIPSLVEQKKIIKKLKELDYLVDR